MKKLSLLVAIMVATFSFAQDKGQWSFGIGTDFTNITDVTPNVGYFVMDGLMVGASFNMEMGDHGHTNWGLDARYYVTGDMFAQFGMSTSYDEDACCGAEEPHDHHADADIDLAMSIGCSKVLGMDGRLWFEPAISMTMPGNDNADGVLGLTMGFRYTF